ncbi:MAG: hypothetical protein ACYDHH_08650 [Solirubrobacteraceae bacterium]
MTRPHDRQREDNKRDAQEPEPELTAEVIQDLDVPHDDSDEIRGGNFLHNSGSPNCTAS